MKIILFVAAILLNWNLAAAAAPAMFFFGDSLVDVGTNILISGVPNAANFPPYGETHFHKPTGRFSNGKIIPDFLAGFLELPFLPPYLTPGANFTQGSNFASAGSGILDSTNNQNNEIIPLRTQIQQFQKLDKDPANISKSVFVIITGSNDLLGGYMLNKTAQQTYNPQQYVQLLSSEFRKSLQMLHQAGARKIAISGVGPLGCTPQLRLYAAMIQNQTGCQADANELSLEFNKQLELLFKDLTSQLRDAKLVYIKPYDLFMDMIRHGRKYGFSVTESNCCGAGQYNALFACGQKIPPGGVKPFLCHKPSKYLFWDFHPTQKACWVLSSKIWSGDTTVVEPVNLRTLSTH